MHDVRPPFLLIILHYNLGSFVKLFILTHNLFLSIFPYIFFSLTPFSLCQFGHIPSTTYELVETIWYQPRAILVPRDLPVYLDRLSRAIFAKSIRQVIWPHTMYPCSIMCYQIASLTIIAFNFLTDIHDTKFFLNVCFPFLLYRSLYNS